MYRISKIQQEGNIYLQELDNYLYDEMVEVKNDKIVFTKEMQRLFITKNLTMFSDITTNIADLKKLNEITVTIINSVTKEEKEIMIEIEGGI